MEKSLQKLLFGLVFLFFISCGSDDSSDQIEITESNLLGTWEITEHKINEISTLGLEGDTQNCEYNAIGSEYMYTITITENPNVIISSGSYKVTTTLICDGAEVDKVEDVVNSTGDQQEGFHVGEWSLENGELVNKYTEIEGGPITTIVSEIKELSDSKLVLSWKRDNSDTLITLPLDGIDVNVVETTSTFTYIKKN